MQNRSAFSEYLKKLSKEELIAYILQPDAQNALTGVPDEWTIYQKIFDESTDALFLTKKDSLKIVLCNACAVRMFELDSKEDFLGNIGSYFRLNPEDKNPDDYMQEGNQEIEYKSKKGRVFWGLKQVKKIEINHSIYRLVRITDITRQKEQEKSRLHSEKLYRSIVDTQQEMVCRFKPDTTLTFINKAYCRNLGKSPEALIGRKFLELIPEKEHKFLMSRLQKVAAEGKPQTNSHIVQLSNGKILWHQWTDVPIYDEQGNLLEFQAVGLDISSQVEIEKSFRESEEKFRALVMAVPVGIFITDEEGNCNWINRQMEQMCQLDFQEALGDGFYKNMLNEDREKLKHFWKSDLAKEQKPFKTACRYQLNNEIRWASISLNPLHAEDQEIAGYVGIVNDFTERKRHEELLINAKSELEKALKAKDEFLSVVSHEIRTPLNSIIGLSHLIEDMVKTPELSDIVDTLQFSSNHLLTMVNDILDFSKIRSGKLQLEYIPFDLKELARQTINMFQSKARDKNISLTQEIDPAIPEFVMGDPSRVGQILNNLISNAVKFTNEGHVILKVGKKDESCLYFFVEDSGIGMKEEEQQKIFEAFTQAGLNTNRKYGGTGLGLTITEKLVMLQNGNISVVSEPGKGTVFTVHLPLETVPQDVAPKANKPVSRDQVKNLSVLYVEDVVPNQLLMKGYCQRWEVKLDIASSGEEALQKLRKHPAYDLILMDIMMPGMDGYETARKIRNMEGDFYQHIPIIAVTASVSNKAARKYLQYGMNEFVEKPINPEELFQKMLSQSGRSEHYNLPKTTVSDRAGKNMFSLLQEYHEQNPQAQAELLKSTEYHFYEYRQQLMRALEKRQLSMYRQISHKLINLLMLYQENDFVVFLQRSVVQLREEREVDKLEQELKSRFTVFFRKLEQMSVKSKNLLK